MHNEEDPRWGSYAAACIRQIWAGAHAVVADEIGGGTTPTGEEEERMTARVFTTHDGDKEVQFEWEGHHNAHYVPDQPVGWRERSDGSREQVYWEGERWVLPSEPELF